jgi:flagellar biosynthesis/type III secretory pathway protein FliH
MTTEAKPYPNEVLTDICTQIIEWGMTPEQITHLATDIPRECEAMIEASAEAAYERDQERLREIFQSGEEQGYREAMKDAGRGHLLR